MGNNQFGQRNMIKLKIKQKLIVFYGLREDMSSLNELRNECNTSVCQYSMIPIFIGSVEEIVNVTNIKKQIKICVPGYIKDLDKICVINPCINQDENYLLFDSVSSFKTWFQQSQNERI